MQNFLHLQMGLNQSLEKLNCKIESFWKMECLRLAIVVLQEIHRLI